MDFHRTGQTSEHRICPKHQTELELCINDTDYSKWSVSFQPVHNNNDNRVAWRCDACIGYWFENHFIDETEWSRPRRIECAQLVLCCPSCNSRRVTHTCDPGCCGSHKCLDCESEFKSHVELIRKGKTRPYESPRLRGQGWNSSGPFEPDHMHRTGVQRDYRKCEKGDHGDLELILIDPIRICDAQVGWYCKVCNRVLYEVGGYRTARFGFQNEAQALAVCPQCSRAYLDSTDLDSGQCRCVVCEAEIQVTLVQSES